MAHSELDMVRHTNNMKLCMTILIVSPFCYAFSMDWREKNMGPVEISASENEIDKIKCLDQLDGICKSSPDLSNFIKKKSSFSFSEMPENARVIPIYRSSHHSSCSCGMEFQLLDLGHAYFPRYLANGVCKGNSCSHHHKCVEKTYKVRVLKQKDYPDQEYSEPIVLPANLRDSWTAETITVGVACECVPSVDKYETT